MKTKITSASCLIFLLIVCISTHAQNTFPSSGSAGIGTLAPNASSLLEMVSTSKGILIPRMTKNQRDNITSPATGLLIYQTNNTPGFYYYDGGSWAAVTPKAKGWSLTGNAGTNPATNFLGTTDAQPLIFKVNNQRAGYIDYLNVPQPSAGNTAFGYQTLISNTGFGNTAMGYNALLSNTTGYYNTATGNSALLNNTTGGFNTAHGYNALSQNTTGSNNAAFGEGALGSNSTGGNNTAIGERSLFFNTTGNDNTASGNYALFFNTTGNYNTATGSFSFRYNTTGSYNTGNGYHALYTNSIGSYNTATGFNSLNNNISGINNTATGAASLQNNTTGNSNTAHGMYGLYLNTTGEQNTSNGYAALYSNTTGNYNSANGLGALNNNTSGSNNSATGAYALYYNSTSNDNTANGYFSLYTNGTGATQSYEATANTATGSYSLYTNGIGYNNTASGKNAMYFNTSGYNNAAYGLQALYGNMTGIGNTAVGVASDVNAGNWVNATAIGYYALSTGSNQVRIGNSSVTSIGGYANWTNISDGRVKKNIKANVPGLAFINKLQPVTYNLNLDEADKIVQRPAKKDKDGKSIPTITEDAAARKDKEAVLYTGFVAQDVEKAAKSLNYDFSGVDAAKNDKDLYGLRYAEFVVPLVKAVQELSKMNDDKNDMITEQQKEISSLKERMAAIETMLKMQQPNTLTDNSTVLLSQNIPNPFSNTTTIAYTLPQKFTKAQMIITDQKGKTVQSLNVSGSGKNNINVQALSLAAGTYNYTLVVNGKAANTKQMIVIK